MKLFLTLFLLLSIRSSRAQDSTRHNQDTIRQARDTVRYPENNYDKTFTKVEIESVYPGGPNAWLRFLNKTLRYPDDAISNNIQGDVIVQFIVDEKGNLSDIEAISGPNTGGLREEAVRLISISGKWMPAIQNGRQVRSYKKQKISFKFVRG